MAAALDAISSDAWVPPARIRRDATVDLRGGRVSRRGRRRRGLAAVEGPTNAPAIRSLAVLPFADLSPGAPTNILAEGVTDAIITEFGQLGAIRVIRERRACVQGSNKSMRDIARELGVDAVLEGSLVRDAGHVRVSARLIRAATESSCGPAVTIASFGTCWRCSEICQDARP